MSRFSATIAPNVEVHCGSDHILGTFIDITDRRYARSEDDYQGEGYVMEWSSAFGFTTNLIGATIEDLASKERLIALANTFVKAKGY